MTTTIARAEADLFFSTPKLVVAQQYPFFRYVCRTVDLFRHLALHLRGWNTTLVWQVKYCRKLNAVENILCDRLREEPKDIGCH
ncbi:hypothetical protein D3C73_1220350 [compost metagenome]